MLTTAASAKIVVLLIGMQRNVTVFISNRFLILKSLIHFNTSIINECVCIVKVVYICIRAGAHALCYRHSAGFVLPTQRSPQAWFPVFSFWPSALFCHFLKRLSEGALQRVHVCGQEFRQEGGDLEKIWWNLKKHWNNNRMLFSVMFHICAASHHQVPWESYSSSVVFSDLGLGRPCPSVCFHSCWVVIVF